MVTPKTDLHLYRVGDELIPNFFTLFTQATQATSSLTQPLTPLAQHVQQSLARLAELSTAAARELAYLGREERETGLLDRRPTPVVIIGRPDKVAVDLRGKREGPGGRG